MPESKTTPQHPDHARSKGQTNLLVGVGVMGVSVLFTIAQIQQSLAQGQLSLPITYDDVVYFSDALRRLYRFYDQGLARFFLDLVVLPFHSVTSTLIALLGFAIFGQQDWAPAAANSVCLIAFLWFVTYLTAHLSWLFRIAIVILVLTCPLMGHLIIDSRPDMLCGLLTASAVFLLLDRSEGRNPLTTQLLAGCAAGVALLAKPSISPVTIAILLTTLVVIVVSNGLKRDAQIDVSIKSFKFLRPTIATLKQYLPFVATTLFISLPYYGLAFSRIADYFYTAVFGATKEVWQVILPLDQQLLYYINGLGGKTMFGSDPVSWGSIAVFIGILWIVVAVAMNGWRSLVKAVPYLIVIGVTYLLVTIPATKSNFLGMAFGSMILLSTVYGVVYIAEALKTRPSTGTRLLGRVVCIAIVLVSLFLFQWAWYNKTSLSRASSVLLTRQERSLLSDIAQQIEPGLDQAHPQCPLKIAFTIAANYQNAGTLEYELLKRRFDDFTMATMPMFDANDLKGHLELMVQSNYVIAFSLDNPTRVTWLPADKLQPQLLDALNAQPFKLIQTFERSKSFGGGKVFLYKNDQAPCKA
ncbi:MAG: hypothetical protein NW224_26285 [Leptolyngbyaceae cyanobacterium bins.302]|nr:hypothetical protein [Leptolyngbyaceae cyanobacterium bins.302]